MGQAGSQSLVKVARPRRSVRIRSQLENGGEPGGGAQGISQFSIFHNFSAGRSSASSRTFQSCFNPAIRDLPSGRTRRRLVHNSFGRLLRPRQRSRRRGLVYGRIDSG